jgi:hypothetical protein
MDTIFTIFLVIMAVLVALAILGGSSWGLKLEAKTAATRVRQHMRDIAIPTEFPVILHTGLLGPGGVTTPAKVELYPTYLLIKTNAPGRNLVCLSIGEIESVTYSDQTKEGLPMAGCTVRTDERLYELFSVGFTSESKMRKMARNIEAVRSAHMGTPPCSV